jgi:hypothetical protein
MNWKFKAVAFKLLSILPFGTQLHYLMQRKITKELPRRKENLDELIEASIKLLKTFQEHNKIELAKATFLEIGAGRDLAVPLALRMLGVGHVICVDVSRLAKPSLISAAAGHISKRMNRPAPVISTWKDVEDLGISYHAPFYLSEIPLDPSSIDCFFSIDTLEHIPATDLREIFVHSRRFLKSHGLSIHFIDYSDHYARIDSVSRFNFLTYSEDEWRFYNNRFQYVNRLRHSQYMNIFTESGFRILEAVADREKHDEIIIDDLADQFKRFELNDLFTIRARICAAPQNAVM